MFQHTAARRRLGTVSSHTPSSQSFQHTAARRRLGASLATCIRLLQVSTHSRPKAAGFHRQDCISAFKGFNTQPPEGGWDGKFFKHLINKVSTHSRPKAAGPRAAGQNRRRISFNTQPPEGGWWQGCSGCRLSYEFQHTAARRRLVPRKNLSLTIKMFQHTAARRRLDQQYSPAYLIQRFNTQPPEGGWLQRRVAALDGGVSTHSRPKAAGLGLGVVLHIGQVSTHSRPKAAGTT